MKINWKSVKFNEINENQYKSIENQYKITWKSMKFNEIQWKSIEINENRWKSVKINEKSMKIDEKSIKINENQWKSMKHLWKSMKHRYSRCNMSRGNAGQWEWKRQKRNWKKNELVSFITEALHYHDTQYGRQEHRNSCIFPPTEFISTERRRRRRRRRCLPRQREAQVLSSGNVETSCANFISFLLDALSSPLPFPSSAVFVKRIFPNP